MNNFYTTEHSRRQKRVKQYIFVTFIITTLSVIPDLIIGAYTSVIIISSFSPLLLAAFFLNAKKTDIAGSLLLLFLTLSILTSNVIFGAAVNANYYYITEYLMLLLVIDNRNKAFLIINNVHIALSILIFQTVTFYPPTLDENSTKLMGTFNVILSIIAAVYLFYTFIVENIEKENYLIRMHKRINIKNKVIENAQINLETFIYRSSHNLQGPIRSIMGLYNLSIFENNSTKLKELIELVNESALKLDKELSITSQVFKINQHTITLSPVNLREFVEDFYQTTNINSRIFNKDTFNTLADVDLLTEGMKNLYDIYLKMRKHNNTVPELGMAINNNIFIFTLTFESKTIDNKYLDNFFAPYQKDLGYLFNLTSEPYMCRRIMDKIHGNVALEKINENTVMFTVTSKLM